MENIQITISKETFVIALTSLKASISNDIELFGKDSDIVIEEEKAYNELLNTWRVLK